MSDLKTRYRFIEFNVIVDSAWKCASRKSRDTLGFCEWYKPWKQWVFQSDNDAVFSEDCLADVRDFLLQLNRRGAPTINSRAAAGGNE